MPRGSIEVTVSWDHWRRKPWGSDSGVTVTVIMGLEIA